MCSFLPIFYTCLFSITIGKNNKHVQKWRYTEPLHVPPSAIFYIHNMYMLHQRISIYSPDNALFIDLTAQNLPHILHVSLYSSSGFLLSLISFAVSGSMAHANCASQSRTRLASAILSSISLAQGIPFAISAAWAAILEATIPCLTSSTFGRARCSAGVT